MIGPVLVVGAGGMLGRAVVELLRAAGHVSRAIDHPQIDLADVGSVERAVADADRVIINCAAYTDVDGAESNVALARAVNAEGVAVLARRARDTGATLVHYSTDYVFSGDAASPYRTDEPLRPLNAYGVSKAEGERALAESGCSFLLLRTSWLYAPWGKNFVRTIARLAAEKPVLRVVDDQRGRPTSAENLARVTLAMLAAGARGTHHATDGGECTWHEFASSIVGGLGLPARIEPCTSAEYPRPAKRPAYSVLDLTSTEALVGPMTPWREALDLVLPRLERPL